MTTDRQFQETVDGAIPIDPVAAYQGMVDRLMPDHARKREFEERQQAIAANLNDDPEFRVTNLSDLSRDSVLTVTHIAAITLEINHVHRCANIDWARKYGQYATGAAAAALKNLVTRTDRIAVHFKLKPSDLLAADEGLNFAEARQWHVPRDLQAKSTNQDERMMPADGVDASGCVEPDKAGPMPLTKNEIASCFAGFREWDVTRWKAELGSPDNWLRACQHSRGTRGKGGYESTWWPVQIAVALVNQDQNSARYLRARFKRTAQLKPWLDELEINIPDNSDSH